MAGDWIKVEHATLDKPEVMRAAEMLGISRDAAVGLFFRFWVWLDKNLSGSCPDFVRNVSTKSLDELMQCPGFSTCLEAIGWAKFDSTQWQMSIPNAGRHNGNTAKSRALDNKRKAETRRENVRQMSGSKPDKNGTREEKRREEKRTTNTTTTTFAPNEISFDAERGWLNVSGKDWELWKSAYPAVDISTELSKAEAWAHSNPKNRKSNWRRFLNSWMSRAQDSARAVGGGQRQPQRSARPAL